MKEESRNRSKSRNKKIVYTVYEKKTYPARKTLLMHEKKTIVEIGVDITINSTDL